MALDKLLKLHLCAVPLYPTPVIDYGTTLLYKVGGKLFLSLLLEQVYTLCRPPA